MSAASVRGGVSAAITIVGAGALGVAAIWGMAKLGFRLTQRYAPLGEQVRRETFEQSRAYREGTLRDLDNLRLDWVVGSAAQKAAIRSVALSRLAAVDPDLLTPELRAWRDDLRSQP